MRERLGAGGDSSELAVEGTGGGGGGDRGGGGGGGGGDRGDGGDGGRGGAEETPPPLDLVEPVEGSGALASERERFRPFFLEEVLEDIVVIGR